MLISNAVEGEEIWAPFDSAIVPLDDEQHKKEGYGVRLEQGNSLPKRGEEQDRGCGEREKREDAGP